MKIIPTIIETYTESDVAPKREVQDDVWQYEAEKGEVVLVNYWVRFPSYDFIFGVPHKDSPRYKKEFAFFQFRKMENGKAMKGWQIYIDQNELEEMQKGFTKLMDVSHVERFKEWSERKSYAQK